MNSRFFYFGGECQLSRLCHHSFFIIFNKILPKQYQRLLKEADKYFIAEKMRRVSENADYALILDGQKLIDFTHLQIENSGGCTVP
ncbi:hypothetical protein [Metabacillus hrfriensis]|uniref:Uncharacterized protein n=1 Tax=Metabacillus hrfriensis TaxID=3048891 RepID=A0ACD4R907_9BACI|nr:hypothetical protein [Metabacillus sp. CT-WN-B3]WHZ56899.1 hypothetical protein QLQ22_19745 [Metabacillus sp. CT-WN-B3]